MTQNELNELNSVIGIISDKSLKVKHNIPYIYTVVVKSVDADGKVKVQFLQDSTSNRNIMTFRNLSGYVPVAGQGAYVLTTGGDNVTGGFIIAIQGQPSTFFNTLQQAVNDLQAKYTSLEERVKALEDKG